MHSREDRKESGRHHAKGTRYVANSLAALLGASAAIWSGVSDNIKAAVKFKSKSEKMTFGFWLLGVGVRTPHAKDLSLF